MNVEHNSDEMDELDQLDQSAQLAQSDESSQSGQRNGFDSEQLEMIAKHYGLNDVQALAVAKCSGPMMLLAGAGSGKTRVVISKILYLLDQGASPYEFLALTFSNKAAREMKERLSLTPYGNKIQVSTFHSFCAGLLRRYEKHSWSIFDEQDSQSLMKDLLSTQSTIKPQGLASYIDQIKGLGHFPEDHLLKNIFPSFLLGDEDSFKKMPEYSWFLAYEKSLKEQDALDFSGLLTKAMELLLQEKTILNELQKRYRYIFVDEYQDTNRAQFLLLYLLATEAKHLCVVGDEDQSIYSWRGADIRNILDFEKVYPHYSLMKLEQNYRSTQHIIEAASGVIQHNIERKGKKLWTNNPQGEKIKIAYYRDDMLEAQAVGLKIRDLMEQGVDLESIAVFYRNSATSRLLEDELRKRRIFYTVYSGLKFYDRKEIKDLLSYLRLLANPNDRLSFKRAITSPSRSIGLKSIENLFASYEEALQNTSLPSMVNFMNWLMGGPKIKLSKKALEGLKSFLTLYQKAKEQLSTGVMPSEVLVMVLESSGYKQSLFEDKAQQGLERLQNIEQLYNAMKLFEDHFVPSEYYQIPTLQGFLETMALDESSLNTNSNSSAADGVKEDYAPVSKGVALMTIHAAKGLEFDYVFILAMDEGIFPSFQSIEQGSQRLEEERRLFYVAMTRARKYLTLCHAKGRMLWGQVRFNPPSMFLEEIDKKYTQEEHFKSPHQHLNLEQHPSFSTSFDREKSLPRSDAPMRDIFQVKSTLTPQGKFASAQWLFHDTYGKGEVIAREGKGDEEKITLRFGPGTIKKFMVKFAALKEL